jgi:hypothetical protein
MERPRHLFREWGLTLALVLAAVLLWWRTMVPALQKNRELDHRHAELLEQQEREQRELERLRASEAAADDPIEIERVQRRQHGELGLPPGERSLPPDDGQ